MFTSPPFTVPETVMGGFPSVEEHFAPMDSKASSNGCIGLFLRLSSPERTVFPSDKDAIAAAILIVVPEFFASITVFWFLNSFIPSIVRLSPVSLICAPNLLHASIVAFVSLARRTFLIMLFPPARDANIIAL